MLQNLNKYESGSLELWITIKTGKSFRFYYEIWSTKNSENDQRVAHTYVLNHELIERELCAGHCTERLILFNLH